MKAAQRQILKAQAHSLKPVILIGSKGLTPAVVEETSHALDAHELIKVKIASLEKEEREAISAALIEEVQAQLIQKIGKIIVIYRKNPEKKS